MFRIRISGPRHVLFRDIHRVGGFWSSMVLLLILAGGMPWTDVWGDAFQWVQKQTGTGYPTAWDGRGLSSRGQGEAILLDQVVDYAQSLNLPGEITISVPGPSQGVFSIHNTYHTDHSQQVAIHLDQYSGREIASLPWKDVGILMRGRMWAMAFHQGQLGTWNWVLVLFTAFGLLMLSTSAIASFFLRKRPGSWGVPAADSYQTRLGFLMIVGCMSILLPLFGLSVIFIFLVERLHRLRARSFENQRIPTN